MVYIKFKTGAPDMVGKGGGGYIIVQGGVTEELMDSYHLEPDSVQIK